MSSELEVKNLIDTVQNRYLICAPIEQQLQSVKTNKGTAELESKSMLKLTILQR